MKKQIDHMVPFPFDAQSSPFFCALASALLPTLGYTQDTPFFCGPKGTFCVNCGNCGGKTTLQKHHLQLYHDYQTFTGVSLGWDWPENDSAYQVIPGWNRGWSWPDEFFSFIFDIAGLSWKRLTKGIRKEDAFAAITASVDMGFPVLMRTGRDWFAVTGYDGHGIVIGMGYGLGNAATIPDWFGSLEDLVVITGRTVPKAAFCDILDRMIQALAHPAHERLETDLMVRLDGITPENARDTAEWLLEKVGFPIEARWHAADSSLYRLCDNQDAKEKVFGMIRQYVFDNELDATHKTCWKIWGQLGVGPHTDYALPDNACALLLKPETQAELKRLFATVFANDRIVLELLREAAGIIS